MNIVFAEPIGLTPEQKKGFSDEMSFKGHNVQYFDSLPTDQSDLVGRVKDADVLVVSNYHVSAEVVNSSSALKMIAVAFTGIDHVPVKLCKEKGIAIFNAAGYSTQAVAELSIALAIDLYRKIVPFDTSTRAGGTRNGYLGNELGGKTFGIIGFGAIGARAASLAQAFGCKVIAWSRTEKKVQGVDFVSIEQLFQKADIVSIHVPLTERTKGLVDESKLKLMKPSAIIINTARGPVVDSLALYNALKNGTIAGAAVDVYEHEPPIEGTHPLMSAPNTILLPHIGFATKEAIYSRGLITIGNIKKWLNC